MYDIEHYKLMVATNGPTTMRYTANNLPSEDDSGWARHRRNNGQIVRMINIHGPFEIESFAPFQRCEDGWLGVDEVGSLFAVDAGDYQDAVQPVAG